MNLSNQVAINTAVQSSAVSHAVRSGTLTQIELNAGMLFLAMYLIWIMIWMWFDTKFGITYAMFYLVVLTPLIILAIIPVLFS